MITLFQQIFFLDLFVYAQYAVKCIAIALIVVSRLGESQPTYNIKKSWSIYLPS